MPVSTHRVRFWGSTLGAAAALAGIALLSPLLVELALERWFIDRGADSAEIDDVDLNLILGTASVEGLEVRLDDRLVLGESDFDVDVSWRALFQGGTLVESAVLEGVDVEFVVLDDGRLRIGTFLIGTDPGAVSVDAAASKEPWWTGIEDLVLRDASLRFVGSGSDVVLKLAEATLTDFSTKPGAPPGRLRVMGRVHGAAVTMDARVDQFWPFADLAGEVSVQGLDLESVAGPGGRVGGAYSGSLSLNGSFSLRAGSLAEQRLEFSGFSRLHGGRLQLERFSVVGNTVEWRGDLVIASPRLDDAPSVELNGHFQGGPLRVAEQNSGLRMAQHQWQLDGQVSVGGTAGRASVIGALSGTASELRVEDARQDRTLVAASRLAFSALRFDCAEGIEIDTLALSEVKLSDGQAGEPRVAIEQARFEGVKLTGSLIERPRKSRFKGVRLGESDRRLLQELAERVGLSVD